MILTCPKTGYGVVIASRAVPKGFEALAERCGAEYGYAFLGCAGAMRTAMSGEFFSLYFQGKDAAFHCLPHSEKGCNALSRQAAGLAPLFAW